MVHPQGLVSQGSPEKQSQEDMWTQREVDCEELAHEIVRVGISKSAGGQQAAGPGEPVVPPEPEGQLPRNAPLASWR